MSTGEVISLSVGIGGLLFGVFTYFTSGVLSDKKQSAIHSVEIENLKGRVKRLEDDIDRN